MNTNMKPISNLLASNVQWSVSVFVGCCCVTVGFTNQVIYYFKSTAPAREQEDNSNESVDSGYTVFKVDPKYNVNMIFFSR